ncbi:MAG: hypothetical protein WAU86_22820, partial [Oricola sp.]
RLLRRGGPLPDWAIEVLEANAGIVRHFALLRFRPGQPNRSTEAMALVTGALRPFDLVLINSNNRAAGLMPCSTRIAYALPTWGAHQGLRGYEFRSGLRGRRTESSSER